MIAPKNTTIALENITIDSKSLTPLLFCTVLHKQQPTASSLRSRYSSLVLSFLFPKFVYVLLQCHMSIRVSPQSFSSLIINPVMFQARTIHATIQYIFF